MVTPKQRKLIKLIRENLGNPNSTKTFGELCLEAGYSKATARNAYLIFNSEAVKAGVEDFTKSLDDKRKLAITHLTVKRLKKAPARELAYVIDLFTKNHQLLSGKSTDRISLGELSAEEQDKINKALENLK